MSSSNFLQNLIQKNKSEVENAPQVIIGTKNPFPTLPSTSQKYFFTDADADINKSSENLLNQIRGDATSEEHFNYGGINCSCQLFITHLVAMFVLLCHSNRSKQRLSAALSALYSNR